MNDDDKKEFDRFWERDSNGELRPKVPTDAAVVLREDFKPVQEVVEKAARLMLEGDFAGPDKYRAGLERAAQIIFDMTEFYQHNADGRKALDDVRGAILRAADLSPKTQGSAKSDSEVHNPVTMRRALERICTLSKVLRGSLGVGNLEERLIEVYEVAFGAVAVPPTYKDPRETKWNALLQVEQEAARMLESYRERGVVDDGLHALRVAVNKSKKL